MSLSYSNWTAVLDCSGALRGVYLPCVTIHSIIKERSRLSKATQVFLGRVEPMNVDVVAMFIRRHGRGQVGPPGIQQPFLANETKPRRKEKGRILHHVNKSLPGDPLVGVYLVRVRLNGQFRFGLDAKEEHVINLVLSPRTDCGWQRIR